MNMGDCDLKVGAYICVGLLFDICNSINILFIFSIFHTFPLLTLKKQFEPSADIMNPF